MNFKILICKLIQNQVRLMSTAKPKNHYKSLGIPSTSTHGEVKTAYYKLSMMYHPDKSKDNNLESARKFRDITEAYEVLGNVKTRKLYDRGLYFGNTTTVDDTDNRFYQSREARSKPPTPTGRTPIYDFDEWSKHHYGATFHRQMEGKKRQRMHDLRREQLSHDLKMEKLIFVLGVVFLICMYMTRDFDKYDNVTYFGSSMPIQTKKED